MISYKIIERNSPEYAQEISLRDRVLRKPLGLTFSEEFLAAELDQLHLGMFEDEKLIACILAKNLGEGVFQLRQAAVSPDKQGMGLGKLLMSEIENRLSELGCKKITMHARDSALEFYLKLGYKVIGDQYLEVGIPHHTMEKELE